MKKTFLFILIALTVLFLISCSAPKVNNFMVPGTKDYASVAGKLDGTWTVLSYKSDKKDFLENFSSAYISFDFTTKILKLEVTMPNDYIEESLKDWKAKWPDLTVKSYKKVLKATCSISSDGDILYIEDQKTSVEILGSGENFESYKQMEIGKSMIPFNKYALQLLDSQYNIKELSDNKVSLISIMGNNLQLIK